MKFNFDELITEKDINLFANGLCDDDLDVLIDVIVQSSVLEILHLGYNSLTLTDGKLTNAIAQSKIKTLVIYHNNIGVEGAKLLANALAQSMIEKLVLSNNNIGAEGAKHLADALKVNKTLQGIDLGSNNIGDKGAKLLANALKNNGTLKVIHLYLNNIGNEGAKSLASMLMVNKSLQKLGLSDNNISDEGAKSLATSFKMNTNLCKLWLRFNKIGDQGAEMLADALEYNNTIKSLTLDCNNNISNHVDDKIQAILGKPSAERKVKKLASQQWTDIILMEGKEISDKVRSLEAELEASAEENKKIIAEKDKQIASLKKAHEEHIVDKEKEIASLKESLKNSKPIIDTVDLTSEESEPVRKRPRTEDTTKSNLAIMHEQNQHHTQRLVQVKKEKNAAEATLETVRGEKEAVEANLEEVKEDLEDSNELAGQLTVTANVWQGRFDELVSLIEAGGQIDGAMISEIRNRPLLS